ncbi:AAA domain-containing protein [uncultured Microbulbifer sp.]|uniref:DEAD/DEAH box helicase n=1 Tax=uncultured Microbulbifer sp. TaxID=348147 RepID=UPI00262D0060|nr:AAA domain-containing protein [uncultured Microbulbifer sp.]
MCEFTYHGESLEASYKAIVLTRKLSILGTNYFEFEVSEDSTESKIEESRYLVLGIMSDPGFPIRTGYSFSNEPGFSVIDPQQLSVRTNRLIGVELVHFDRIGRRVKVKFSSGYGQKFSTLFEAIMNSAIVSNCDIPIFLMEGEPYDDSKTTNEILREVGHPSTAKADSSAVTALGRKSAKKKSGTDPVTPVSKFLWEAKSLAKNNVRDSSELKDLLNKAKTVNQFPINESQQKAVKGCAKQQLGIMWGPPGTGKTDTLSALIHSTIDEAIRTEKGKKILITGPNYRAVEELTGRLVKSINSDSTVPCQIYMGYSRSRDPQSFPAVSSHVRGGSLRFTRKDPLFYDLQNSIKDPTAITVVATSAHAIPGFVAELGYDKRIVPLFDFAVIDESSQVSLSLGLRPLSVLKEEGQLTVAGDHKQMPPIFSLDAPAGAEYLVGSIQSYFLERFKISTFPLLINYRSCKAIVDYAKLLDYPQELRAENPDLKLHRISNSQHLPVSLPSSTLFESVIDPDKSAITLVHEDIASSQANPDEVDLVVSIVWSLYTGISASLDGTQKSVKHEKNDLGSFFDKAVGIVTPHKAQKALVISKLRELFPAADPDKLYASVDTVERFQGGQRQTIIVSFGVGDTEIIEGEEEFLLQLERTNVAVSRAMAKCIMIMPKSLAYHLPGDKNVAESAIAIKSYIDEFCGERESHGVNFQSGAREVELRWHTTK